MILIFIHNLTTSCYSRKNTSRLLIIFNLVIQVIIEMQIILIILVSILIREILIILETLASVEQGLSILDIHIVEVSWLLSLYESCLLFIHSLLLMTFVIACAKNEMALHKLKIKASKSKAAITKNALYAIMFYSYFNIHKISSLQVSSSQRYSK